MQADLGPGSEPQCSLHPYLLFTYMCENYDWDKIFENETVKVNKAWAYFELVSHQVLSSNYFDDMELNGTLTWASLKKSNYGWLGVRNVLSFNNILLEWVYVKFNQFML